MKTKKTIRSMKSWTRFAIRGVAIGSVLALPTPFTAPGAPVLAATAHAQPADRIDPEVLRVREAAWRAWFGGDEAALRKMLPPEFIALDSQGGPRYTLDQTVERAKSFHASGSRLQRLVFPETEAQRYGDVVVLYGTYSAVISPAEVGAAEVTIGGRLTEVFVRKDGRWLHPGWHLDSFPAP